MFMLLLQSSEIRCEFVKVADSLIVYCYRIIAFSTWRSNVIILITFIY